MRAVVMNPHCDDGMIGAGGTIIQLLNNGWEIMYVQMTDGRHGIRDISPEEARMIRLKEGESEREFLNVKHFFNFDLEDGILNSLDDSKKEEVVNKLVEILNDFNPQVVFMPTNGDAHTDHRATYSLTNMALELSAIKPLKVFYLVWLLPFLSHIDRMEKVLRIDISKDWPKKKRGLLLHKSQEIRRHYSQSINNLNSYFSLIYSKYDENSCDRVEVLGIRGEENLEQFLDSLAYKDVTGIYHGRDNNQISV